MKDLRAADLRAREAAQILFDRPVMLEAGAGTGKTTTLVARVLSWALGSGWDRAALRHEGAPGHDIATDVLQGMVAITFTEAAAAEMATRIAESLAMVVDQREQEIHGFDPRLLELESGERRERAAWLLETFDHLTVGTIHAFCFGLLTDHPLEAGLHPELRVDADGSELETIARQIVERATQRAYGSTEDTPFLTLARQAIGPAELLEAATSWVSMGAPPGELDRDPFAPELVDRHVEGLEQRLKTCRRILGDSLSGLARNQLAGKIAKALEDTRVGLHELRNHGRADIPTVAAALEHLWPENLLRRLGEWSTGKLETAIERERLEPLGDPFLEAAGALRDSIRFTSKLDPELLTAGRQALASIVQEIESDLRRRGVITFSGLLRQTRTLLRDSPDVLVRLRQRIDLLLVDEFQDTDPVQSEIVRLLALEGPSEECPSLFVVGDPKQSIYGWRDADLAAYEAFQTELERRGGERFSLSINFRSAQEVLDEVERVVAPIMDSVSGIQPPFQQLEAAPLEGGAVAFRHDNWREIEYWVSWQSDPAGGRLIPGTHAQAQRLEARAVAEDIRRLHDQAGVPWNEIGVLFRKSSPQPTFLEELRRQGVPFAVTRDRNYFQRREIIEAAAWVRTILNPADHLALLTVLRSVTVGVPDAALIPLWNLSFPKLVTELREPDEDRLEALKDVVFAASEAMPVDVPGLDRIADWEQSLVSALASLARLRLSYRSDPADVFVARIRGELMIEAFEAARFQGRFRLANLNRFYAQLEAALDGDDSDVHAILRALRLGVLEARQAEEAMPRDAIEEAVQIMTIHTAKGLEFGHVYLVQMHTGTGGAADRSLEAREIVPDDWEYRLFQAPTLNYLRAEDKTRRIEAAEAVRTLYVAMTRAKERLVLIGKWPETPIPVAPEKADNYVDLAQNRSTLPGSIGDLANDPAIQLLGYYDEDGVRWRFLGGSRTHGGRRSQEEPASWIFGAAALRRNAVQHEKAQEEAVDRMSKRLTQGVSTGLSKRLEDLADTLAKADGEGSPTGHDARSMAMSVGTLLHRALETWDLDSEPEIELTRQKCRLAGLGPPIDDGVATEAASRLDALAHSNLLERLQSLRSHIVGREVPLIMTTEGKPDDPLAALTGAIDLLYRDPADGRLVVADFKSDRLETQDDLVSRAEVYALQELHYARAVQAACDLDEPPRCELWWLWLDRITDADGETL